MAKKNTRFRNDKNDKGWCSWQSEGAWSLKVIIDNDEKLGDYVSKNKKALLSLPKKDKVSLIKRNISESWVKRYAKKVKLSNVKVSELNMILKHY